MPLIIRDLFSSQATSSSQMPDHSREEKKEALEAQIWGAKHDIRYIMPRIERALGACKSFLAIDLIKEARSFGLNSKELDLAELRCFFLNGNKEVLAKLTDAYLKKHPLDVSGWMIWIQLKLITMRDDTKTLDQFYIVSAICEAFKHDEVTQRSLLIFASNNDFTVQERTLCFERAVLNPENPFSMYVFLSYPDATELKEWLPLFDRFMSKDYPLPLESAADIVACLLLTKDYDRLLNWIDSKKDITFNHLSFNFLKLIVYLKKNDRENFHGMISYIRSQNIERLPADPLFVGAEQARAIVQVELGKLTAAPADLVLQLGELLAYLNETDWALKLLKQALLKYPADSMLLAKVGCLQAYTECKTKAQETGIKGLFECAFKYVGSDKKLKAEIHNIYGNALFHIKLYSEALSQFKQGPEDTSFGYIASVYYAMRNWDEAIKTLDEAAKKYPLTFADLRLRGSCYHQKSHYLVAAQCYTEALQKKKGDSATLALKASALLSGEDYERAMLNAEKAIAAGACDYSVLDVLAYASHKAGYLQKSFETYKKMMGIKPLSDENLLIFSHDGNELNRFQDVYNALVGRDLLKLPEPIFFRLIMALDQLGKTEELKYHLDVYLKGFKPVYDLVSRRAFLHLDEHNIIGAMQRFEEALTLKESSGLKKILLWCRYLLEPPISFESYTAYDFKPLSSDLELSRQLIAKTLIWDILAQHTNKGLVAKILENPALFSLDDLKGSLKSGTIEATSKNVSLEDLFKSEKKIFKEALVLGIPQIALVSLYSMIVMQRQMLVKDSTFDMFSDTIKRPSDITLTQLYRFQKLL